MELQFHAKNGVEWRALVRSGLAELDLDWNCHSQLELEWRVVRPTAGRQDWDGVAWHPEVIYKLARIAQFRAQFRWRGVA